MCIRDRKYAVNRGLRDLNGNGVLTGLTEISEIQSSKMVDGEKVPCEGKLFYRCLLYTSIVGDIFDRGPRPDIILDELMRHHSVDVQWGNHDVQWLSLIHI